MTGLAVNALFAAVAALAIIYAQLTMRGERREHHRKEQQLYSYVKDLLDRNMHLTDGGAFTGGRTSVAATDAFDAIIGDTMEGIFDDVYDAPTPVYVGEHGQPTVDDLT